MKWMFPALSEGGAEGFSNAGLEMFKGDVVKALAREVCQNSLDAQYDDSVPVRIEIKLETVNTGSFPGVEELKRILGKCEKSWSNDKNAKTQNFIQTAQQTLRAEKIKVLRISDFNTTGLQGAFEDKKETAWTGLVKSSGMSVKSSGNAAGSYGIGKNAPFVNSSIQTVFYRTYDVDEVRAAQGVARLMSFDDDGYSDGFITRRAVGYFGSDDYKAIPEIPMLDQIYLREEHGTDLFIPAIINFESGEWVQKMLGEILDNFLLSIYNGKLEVVVANELLNKETVNQIIARCKRNIKEATFFNRVLNAPDDKVFTDSLHFSGLGDAKIKVLYENDLNQQVLVVRSSGMKIAEISRLPKTIQFSGILELTGDKLNEYFREMETPQHNKWEPNRHPTDPQGAKEKLDRLEAWVRDIIDKKASENIAEQVDIDNIHFLTDQTGDMKSGDGGDSLIDSSVSAQFQIRGKTTPSHSSYGKDGSETASGFVDPEGSEQGYRHRTGQNGGTATGRNAFVNPLGPDTVKTGRKQISSNTRIVKKNDDITRVLITPSEEINDALLEFKTKGDNGKSLPLFVQEVRSEDINAYCKNGKVYIDKIDPGKRAVIDVKLGGNQNFALGVTVYGNKE